MNSRDCSWRLLYSNRVSRARCPLLAQSGHLDCAEGCPLLGVKRTSQFDRTMSLTQSGHRDIDPSNGAVEPAKFVCHHASGSGRKLGLAACALVHVNALLRADTHPRHRPAMAPLPLLAQHQLTTKSDTTGTCCSRLLANSAQRGPLPMPLRLSQSNRHGNGEQRYRESPQHGFFLPSLKR
jgi:hypothetical protein